MSAEAEEVCRVLATEQEFWNGMSTAIRGGSLGFHKVFAIVAVLGVSAGAMRQLADRIWSTELDSIVTPERGTHEDIDDVLRSFIDLAAQHKRRSSCTRVDMTILLACGLSGATTQEIGRLTSLG